MALTQQPQHTPPSSSSDGGRYLAHQNSMESLSWRSSGSFLDVVNRWTDDDVARWLQDHRMQQYAAVFRDNDIRGSVILDVDQNALKEMKVTSVGDRVKIVVAIKKLRAACIASKTASRSVTHSGSSSSLNAQYATAGGTYQVKRTNSTNKPAQRIPPPLHLHQSEPPQPSYRGHQQQNSASSTSTSSLLSAPPKSSSIGLPSPSATSPAQHIRRASSPRQAAGPPSLPAPRGQLPMVPSTSQEMATRERARTSSATQNVPLGQATRSTKYPAYTQAPPSGGVSVPALNVTKAGHAAQLHRKTASGSQTKPATAGASYHQPLNLSHHPYAINHSPTADQFEGPSSRPGTAPISNKNPDHPRSASQSDKSVGFSVGKGGFARPTTSAGTLSSTPAGLVITSTMEDLLRKTIKFGSEEDGVTKLVNVENITDVVEILTRVLKKFSKLAPSAKLSRLWDGDLTYSELDGWGIYASGGDGIGRWLADSDLVNICQSVNRPERQRGLLLRRVDPKRTLPRSKMQSYFVGDGSHMQHAPGQPSPTSPTDMLGVYLPSTAIEPPASAPSSPDPLDGDVATSLIADQYSPDRRGSKMNRASTVSVMSGLLDWNTTNQTRSPSLSTALSNGTTRLRHFFGHRPPSELIASHLTDYFPSAEKKLLTKTIRNSVRKSVAPRPRSQFANWDANSSRFSISSAGSSGTAGGLEPPPPLPSKEGNEHFAAVPLNHENSRWSRMPTSGSGSSLDEEGDSDNLPKDTAAVLDSLDDDSMGVRRSKSRQSQSSRMSSRLSIKTSKSFGKDSDNASLLTVDEITAEVEHRRMSMASTWTSAGPAIHVADESEYSAGDDRSRSSRSSISSERESEEEESETDEDDEVDEDDLAPEKVTSTGTKNQIKWIKGALIGAGSFGQVFLAMNATIGTLMAVKQVEIPKGDSHNESRKKSMLDALEREIELLKGLQHENIVEYLDSSSDGTHLNIFLEYVPGGSVVALLRNYGAFEEMLVRNFVRQVLQGLSYLHERDIVHRDIKGANILVDNKGLIKISDFGISKRVEDNLLSGVKIHRPSLQGSVFWMAPEVVKQTSYTSKADVWSLGCVTIEMLTGDHPHIKLNQMQALFKIGTASAAPEMPPDVSVECQNFLQMTFLQDYNARPSAAQLLQTPFITETGGLSQKTPTASSFPI